MPRVSEEHLERRRRQILDAAVVRDLQAFFHELAHGDPLLPIDELVERLAVKLVELSAEGGPLRLAPEAWALSMHEPEIARYVAENVTLIRDTWTSYVRRLVDAGLLPSDTDVESAGKALFAIMPGFLLQRLIVKDISPEELRRGIKALTRDSMLTPPI